MAKADTLDPMAVAALTGNNTGINPKLLEKYLETAIKNLESDAARREAEDEAIRKKFLDHQKRLAQGAQMQEKARLAEEENQKLCAHMNERGGSLVQGQRVGRGNYSFRCFACGKQYTQWNEIPLTLRHRPDRVGGPTAY